MGYKITVVMVIQINSAPQIHVIQTEEKLNYKNTDMAAIVPSRAQSQGTYTFASQPRAVQQRKKYRNETEFSQ